MNESSLCIPRSQSARLVALFNLQNSKQNNNNENETRKKENWEKMKKLIEFSPTSEDYYDNFSVQPGFWFWKFLANCDSNLEDLSVLIPKTLICLGNNNFTYLFFDETKNCICRKTEQEINILEFERILEKKKESSDVEDDQYFIVQRSPGNFKQETQKTIYTKSGWRNKRSLSSALDWPSMLQEFIYSKGPAASIIRICFKTCHSQENKASHGFKITNIDNLSSKNSKLSASQKASLCKDRLHSFSVTPLFSGYLANFKPQLDHLVFFLERTNKVFLTELVVDFIIEKQNRPVLINIKGLKMIQPFPCSVKNMESLSCSVFCKLCGNSFKQAEARKLLTYKLLWEFEQHLIKRGVKIKTIESPQNTTKPCRVCDLCYTVVVSEHKLIEYEQKFALFQNIKLSDLYIKIKSNKRPKNRPHFVPGTLQQWRLLLLIKQLRFEQTNSKVLELLSLNSDMVYLQMKVNQRKYSYKVKLEARNKEGECLFFVLKVLQVLYLFSESNESLQSTTKELDIKFGISLSNTWGSNCLMQGSSGLLKNFNSNIHEGQKNENVVYLFTETGEYATLKLTSGLMFDGLSDTSNLNLFKTNSVYLPDEDFYNCNVFPEQWMEIFTDGYIKQKDEDGTKKPELKIKKDLMLLESVLSGKYEIQKDLLKGSQFNVKNFKRDFSNFSCLNLSQQVNVANEKTNEKLKGSNFKIIKKTLDKTQNLTERFRNQEKNEVTNKSTHRRLNLETARVRYENSSFRIEKENSKSQKNIKKESSFKSVMQNINDVNNCINKIISAKGNDENVYKDYLNMVRLNFS